MGSDVLITSLLRLGDALRQQGVPTSVKAQAMAQNPWFTEYYIDTAVENILQWFTPDALAAFTIKDNLLRSALPSVGIIAAGNVPLVGLHDVLMAVLAGCRVYVKPSHQDTVLMRWFMEAWTSFYPALKDRIEFVQRVPDGVAMLLATGSNNTARYIEADYFHTPKVIRKNRFSVAMLTDAHSEMDMQILAADILLYNGLGCRNVSNVIVCGDSTRLIPALGKALATYDVAQLNPLYLQKLARERAQYALTNALFWDATTVLLVPAESLQYAQMGVLYVIAVPNEAVAAEILHHEATRIQCVVGKSTNFGMAQAPTLDRFADDVNTFELCLSLCK